MIDEDPTLNCQWKQFDNPGYLILDVPKPILSELELFVKYLLENNFNSIKINAKLAGHIKHEYKLPENKALKQFILYSCILYHETYKNGLEKKEIKKADFSDIWVNFQKKTEFNPVHDHSGDYSFVIWHKIPFFYEEEIKNESSIQSTNPPVSAFQFQYVNSIGRLNTETLQVDKQWEGKMIVFPASLHHCVYPFYTSDEYRISIAGNLTI